MEEWRNKENKSVVTSREEYLKSYGDYIKYFRPDPNIPLIEYRMVEISDDQRSQYVHKLLRFQKQILPKMHTNRDLFEIEKIKTWDTFEKYDDII